MEFITINTDFSPELQYLFVFLITISVIWFILVLYSLKNNGFRVTVRYFFPMMVAALFIEASGVSNGRFSYPNYFLYLSVLGGQVPLIILIGWSTNLFIFLNFSKSFVDKFYHKGNFFRVLLISIFAGLIGICLDILEDPVAHHNQWWIWTESSAFITVFDVPLSNFVDWFFILFFMVLSTLIIDRFTFSENRKVLLSFTSLPLVFLAIYGAHLLITVFI